MPDKNKLKLDDFIQDWQIDVKHKAARHKSGLVMRHLMDNEDGTFKIEFANLMEWEDGQLAQKKDVKTIQHIETELIQQFGVIYKSKIKPENDVRFARLRDNQVSR